MSSDKDETRELVEQVRREVWPDLTDDEFMERLAGLALYVKKWESNEHDTRTLTRLSDAVLHLREEGGTDDPHD